MVDINGNKVEIVAKSMCGEDIDNEMKTIPKAILIRDNVGHYLAGIAKKKRFYIRPLNYWPTKKRIHFR